MTSTDESDPLERLNYDSFRRLVGLFDSIPKSLPETPNNESVKSVEEKIQEISEKLDPANGRFRYPEMSGDIHNLELRLLRILPPDLLNLLTESYRSEFREIAGDDAYRNYQASISALNPSTQAQDIKEADGARRADATFLLNHIRNFHLLRLSTERTKAWLLKQLWSGTRKLILFLTIPIALFFINITIVRPLVFGPNIDSEDITEKAASLSHHTPTVANMTGQGTPEEIERIKALLEKNAPDSPGAITRIYNSYSITDSSKLSVNLSRMTLLCIIGIAGACGAFVSVLKRIQQLVDEDKITRNVLIIKNSEISIRFAPVTGALFAVMLSLIFAGGLAQGALFPTFSNFQQKDWFLILYYPAELAKLLVWSFIAGFSERLVPDLLDHLLAKNKTGSAVKPATIPISSAVKENPAQLSTPQN